jgi:pilus assembly protein Flp/PilA
MTALLRRFAKDESGASAADYGLIATFVAVAILTCADAFASK